MELNRYWITVEGKLASYESPIFCFYCQNRIKRGEKTFTELVIIIHDDKTNEVASPGGGQVGTWCEKCDARLQKKARDACLKKKKKYD